MVAAAEGNMAEAARIIQAMDIPPEGQAMVTFTPIPLVHIKAAEAEQFVSEMLTTLQKLAALASLSSRRMPGNRRSPGSGPSRSRRCLRCGCLGVRGGGPLAHVVDQRQLRRIGEAAEDERTRGSPRTRPASRRVRRVKQSGFGHFHACAAS